MKTKLLVLMILAGGTLFAGTRVSIGVAVGGPAYGYYPPPPPPVVMYSEPCPGPDYTWVPGYWYYQGPRRFWRAGYWNPPPRYYRPYGRHHEREWDREHYRDHDRGRRGYDRDYRRDYRR